MPGLVPGIHVFAASTNKDVDGRDEPGHDDAAVRIWRGPGGSNSYLLVGGQARTPVRQARGSWRRAEGTILAPLWLEHDLFRKPVSTFRDHALRCERFSKPPPAPAGLTLLTHVLENDAGSPVRTCATWPRRQDLNPQPPGSNPGALSVELRRDSARSGALERT